MHSVYEKKKKLYTFKLSKIMSPERTERIPRVLFVSLNGLAPLKPGMNLFNLASSPTRLLKSSLECSVSYNEKFE